MLAQNNLLSSSGIRTCVATLGLLALIVGTPARSEIELSGTYYGLQYSDSRSKFESNLGTAEESEGHIKGKYGWVFNDYVSLEGQLGLTTDSDGKDGVLTYGGYVRLDKDFGQYKTYGLLGFGGLNAYSDGGDDVTESSGSIGVGVEIFGSRDTAITLEYVRILDTGIEGGDLTFDAIGLGFTYYFSEDSSFFNKNRNKIQSIRD